MIEFKTKIAEELEKAYLAGFDDGMKRRILHNIIRDSDDTFEAFIYFTKIYLESLQMKEEDVNKHLNYLRSHRNKQEPRQIDYNI